MNIIGTDNGYYNIFQFYNSNPTAISTYFANLCAVQKTTDSGESLIVLRPTGIPTFSNFTPNSGYIVLAKNSFELPEDQQSTYSLTLNITGTSNGYYNIIEYPYDGPANINTYFSSLCAVQKASNSGESLIVLRPAGFPSFTQFTPGSGYIILAKEDFKVIDPESLFAVITQAPDPNLLSYVQFNDWTIPDDTSNVDVGFVPMNKDNLKAYTGNIGLPVAGAFVIPDYAYWQPDVDYFLCYINRPDCPLSGWFVNLYTDEPGLINSSVEASPTYIPTTGWEIIKSTELGVPGSISASQLPILPYVLGTGVGGQLKQESAFLTTLSTDYIFDTNSLTFYRSKNLTGLDNFSTLRIFDSPYPYATRKLDLSYFKGISSLSVFSTSALKELTLPQDSPVAYLFISSNSNTGALTAIHYDINKSYSNLTYGFLNLSADIITDTDNIIDFTIKSIYNTTSAQGLTSYGTDSGTLIYLNISLNTGRTSASDDYILKSAGYNSYRPLEIDAYYPVEQLPVGSYYPHTLGDTITVQAPISTNNAGVKVRFNALSGIYVKTGDIKDNRDVFRNSNDYFVLFDEPEQRWTVIGPLSTSETIWLTAKETLGDYGNIPILGWGGPAWHSGGIVSDPYWLADTCVFSTQMFAFSSLRTSAGGRYGFDPFQGFNSDSYWKDFDFSGIGYQNVSDPEWNGRAHLVSSVHFVNTIHFPSSLPPGTLLKFVHKDGSISTRSVLSAVDLQKDIRIGILNEPVSAACYPIGFLNAFLNNLNTKSDWKNFLLGPTTKGEVSYGIPDITFALKFDCEPDRYSQFISVPKSGWYSGKTLVVGDSSTGVWGVSGNQLALLGIIKFASFQGETSLYNEYNSLFYTATALSKQFYGDPYLYTLTAFNFNGPTAPTPT